MSDWMLQTVLEEDESKDSDEIPRSIADTCHM